MSLYKKLRKHPDLKNLTDEYLESMVKEYEADPQDFLNSLDEEPLNEKEVKILRKYME